MCMNGKFPVREKVDWSVIMVVTKLGALEWREETFEGAMSFNGLAEHPSGVKQS